MVPLGFAVGLGVKGRGSDMPDTHQVQVLIPVILLSYPKACLNGEQYTSNKDQSLSYSSTNRLLN